MRFAVVQHHELHHGGQTAPILFRCSDLRGFHVRWDANADDFGFGDGQWISCVKNASVLLMISNLAVTATGMDQGEIGGQATIFSASASSLPASR